MSDGIDSAHPAIVAVDSISGEAREKAHLVAGVNAEPSLTDEKLVNELMERIKKPIMGVLRMWGAQSGANINVTVYLEKPR